jgi:hypothetical protein
MSLRVAGYGAMLAALLACHRQTEDRIERIEPARYRGPAVPSVTLPKESAAGALVGAIFDCRGRPLQAMFVTGRRVAVDTGTSADTVGQVLNSTFTLSSLTPGVWQLRFGGIGFYSRVLPVTIRSGRVDTLMVQMSETSIRPIGDCVCPDGRSFGSQCCPKPKPVTTYKCNPREPAEINKDEERTR